TNQYIHRLSSQKSSQSSMSSAVRTNHFTGNYFIIFHLINFEKLCFSKMLKNISIIISYRYFHLFFLTFLYFNKNLFTIGKYHLLYHIFTVSKAYFYHYPFYFHFCPFISIIIRLLFFFIQQSSN